MSILSDFRDVSIPCQVINSKSPSPRLGQYIGSICLEGQAGQKWAIVLMSGCSTPVLFDETEVEVLELKWSKIESLK